MAGIVEKFIKLKTSIGGNREKTEYEDTFGMPKEEQMHITRPNRADTRIISELEFAMHLSETEDGRYDSILERALDFLLDKINAQGALVNQDCEAAEEMLAPMAQEAKSYKLILAAHAHIDMNWMWSFNETVAVTLATFRSILNIMEQYPEFCYSQSQGAVYRIVEEYDPEMMEEIKKRIAEGRWEVTASAWVETDKNMPTGESLLRHIQYTKEYMKRVWDVDGLEVDFSPDTFGHSANVPEIDRFGEVKYYYHCRGNGGKEILYRYRAPSGKDVLAYREPNWYNGAITPHMAAGFPEISKRCMGLRTGLVVYGVGDHGGGPTRRDVERALEMMEWPIYPRIQFGTFHAFFKEAESLWEKLPVVERELNYFAPGCYTTQSRIKRANRRLEAALLDAEALSVMAGEFTGFGFAKEKMEKAWRDVLFTHFHDILTGSCVQDSREHAMGLFQTSMATANTQMQKAMSSISRSIDTSSVPVDVDPYYSQSEGAGAGYGIENFIGVPSTERGGGRTRIFHIFNTLSWQRRQTAELTVWDWTGDLRRIRVTDHQGKDIQFQLLDKETQHYWSHRYIRVLVDVTVPALGYTTVVLSEREPETYPVYFQEREHVARVFDDYILENDRISARIASSSGRIVSVRDKNTGVEMIGQKGGAGFTYIETETASSSAWDIGRYIRELPVERCLKLELTADGPLRKSVKANWQIADSKIEATYSLDQYETAVKVEVKADWHESGSDIVPVLEYRIPLAYEPEDYQYDIPAGVIRRKALHGDVPGLQYGMARRGENPCMVLISDSKYGYRAEGQKLATTLINSATYPDPYPERGIHHITLWLGTCDADARKAEQMATSCNHSLFCQPSNAHHGTLPMESGLFRTEAEHTVISAVLPGENRKILVRVYETAGKKETVRLEFGSGVAVARLVNLLGKEQAAEVTVSGNRAIFVVEPYALSEAEIELV
ncbi:MAG: alpha-mannosidase [Lachnospiraceae bacterium]|nr:alpha-mannosidase [Lachnospiraceae bacterium]